MVNNKVSPKFSGTSRLDRRRPTEFVIHDALNNLANDLTNNNDISRTMSIINNNVDPNSISTRIIDSNEEPYKIVTSNTFGKYIFGDLGIKLSYIYKYDIISWIMYTVFLLSIFIQYLVLCDIIKEKNLSYISFISFISGILQVLPMNVTLLKRLMRKFAILGISIMLLFLLSVSVGIFSNIIIVEKFILSYAFIYIDFKSILYTCILNIIVFYVKNLYVVVVYRDELTILKARMKSRKLPKVQADLIIGLYRHKFDNFDIERNSIGIGFF